MFEMAPSTEKSTSTTAVVELLECGDTHLSVVITKGDKLYRVDEGIHTDDPVYLDEPLLRPLDESDPYYHGQHIAGAWDVFDRTEGAQNETLLRSGISFEVAPGMLGCLMDVIPGSRWYRALDEGQAQYILDRVMEQLIP